MVKKSPPTFDFYTVVYLSLHFALYLMCVWCLVMAEAS